MVVVTICISYLAVIVMMIKDVDGSCKYSADRAGCNTCSGDKCAACHNGYYLDEYNNRCLNCVENCYNCENSTKCFSCNEQYYEKIDLVNISNNNPYNKSFCLPCPDDCQFCYLTVSSNDKADCDTCKQGYYRYLSQNSSIHLCKKCKDDCMACEGSDSNCTRCKDGYRLIGSVCEKIPNTKPILIVGAVGLFFIVIGIVAYWSCCKPDTNQDLDLKIRKDSIHCRNGTSPNFEHDQGLQIEIGESDRNNRRMR